MQKALKYWDGANPKIYVILTQKEDGGWHLACHWTDRVLEYDCELIEDRLGQHLRYGSGSILPLRNSKGELYPRWSEATEEERPYPQPLPVMGGEEPEPDYTDTAELGRLKAENDALLSRIAEMEAERQKAKQTRRKKQQPQHLEAAAEQQPTREEPAVQSSSNHNVLKAIGSVAAMAVALVVIWETGLLIPLGLIGLGMSGLIK